MGIVKQFPDEDENEMRKEVQNGVMRMVYLTISTFPAPLPSLLVRVVDVVGSLDASNPLYLHANDSNGTPLISIKLTGVDNYRARSELIDHGILQRDPPTSAKSDKPQASVFVSRTNDNRKNNGNNEIKTSTGTLSFSNEQVLKLISLLNDKSGYTDHANMAVGHPNGTLAKLLILEILD
ncbi:hypothetical protein Tco_0603958 [Tanacetum coccineum]